MTDQKKADFWVTQINRILSNNLRFKKGHPTLEGIRDTIKASQKVSEKQIKAIKNIRWGKNDFA